MNSDGSGSNLATIDPNTSSNRIKASQEPYYFKGAGARNYVKYNDKLYRIYYIDTDDTLILYSEESFGSTFNGKTLSISSVSLQRNSSAVLCNGIDNMPRVGEERDISTIEGEAPIYGFDVYKTSYCATSVGETRSYVTVLDAWMRYTWYSRNGTSYISTFRGTRGGPYAYKIHLNSSFKLGSGTGDYANPYILEEK